MRSGGDSQAAAARCHDLLQAQAESHPDRVAVEADGGSTISYRALDERSTRWAHRLRALGVGPEVPVGLCAGRSTELIVALWAIWKAGGVYVPLDPALPRRRLETLVEDARIALALVDGETDGWMAAARTVRLDTLDVPGPEGSAGPAGPEVEAYEPTADHAAYVIYTSGSTGHPKGVVVTHGSLVNFARVLPGLFDIDPDSRVLQVGPLHFDISLFEILMAFAAGATLHLARPASLTPGSRLGERLAERRITHLMITPTMLGEVPRADLGALRVVIVGGEACPPALVGRWLPGRRMFNAYGPTEATICATVFEMTGAAGAPPIGPPIAAAIVRLLDPEGALVPDGEPGEIHIGGPGVARGYLGRPEWTAGRFLPDPDPRAPPGARLYRTGDVGRRRPDGALEYLGRIDEQMKVHGVRIEPGEIEALLCTAPGVREAVVAPHGDPAIGKRLVAWVVAGETPGEDARPSVWRRFLGERLPAVMVPSAFVVLPALPRLPNGKVDRRGLPAPAERRPSLSTEFVAPATELERLVATLVADVLGVQPVGAEDDLLELGADSLRMGRLLAGLRDTFGAELEVAALYARPTVRELARAVASSAEKPTERARVAAHGELSLGPAPRTGVLHLSSAQQRLWFLHQLDSASRAYHLPVLLRIQGPLDVAALELALGGLVRRHEALRTIFPTVPSTVPSMEGVPEQRILPAPASPLSLPVTDLTRLPVEAREAALAEAVRDQLEAPFDLERGPLWRPRLYRLGPMEHALALAMHHLVVDGWSIGVLVRELAALYRGEEPPAPQLQPADLAVWERRRLDAGLLDEQLTWWRRELADAPMRLPLPMDRPRPSRPSVQGARRPLRVPAPVAAALRDLGRAHGATPFMTLLAAFALCLRGWSGVSELVLGTPVAHRNRRETEGVVGFLANTLALRLRLAGAGDFRALLGRVRRMALDAWGHEDVPFDKLVEVLRLERDPRHQPLFQVLFALQEPPAAAMAGGVSFEFVEMDAGGAPFDLTVQLWEARGKAGFEGSILYATDLFDAATIDRLAGDFTVLLERLVAESDAPLAALLPEPPPEGRSSGEAALLADPAVLDAVVRVRRGESGERCRVAYVVLARGVAPGIWRPPATAAGIDAIVPVTVLPLDAEGRIDDHALAQLPVIDGELAGRAVARVRQAAGIADAAAVMIERSEPTPRLQIRDILPVPALASIAPAEPAVPQPDRPPAWADGRPPAWADGGPLDVPDDAPQTLPAALRRIAERHGDHGILYVEAQGVTSRQSYAELYAEARGVSAGLLVTGLRPGERVILQIESLRDHYTAFWGCVLGGLIPVTVAIAPVYEAGQAVADKLVHAWNRLGRPAILASRQICAPLGALHALGHARLLPFDFHREDLARVEGEIPLHEPSPDAPAFVQLSSGSTGAVKCIPETHRAIVRHVHALTRHNGYGPDDVTLSWLPPDHVTTLLMCHLKDTYLGCRQVHVRTEAVLADPLLLFDLVDAHRVTHLLSPNFGYQLLLDALSRAPGRNWDLSSLQRVANGAEQVTLGVTREFLWRAARFGFDPRAMQPGFGMAEVASAVTFEDGFDPAAGIQHALKSSLDGVLRFAEREGPDTVSWIRLGRPVPGVELRIVGDEGHLLPEARIGRLQIRGGVVMPGYLDDEEANRAAFVGDGWFDSGDLGFLMEGRLTVTGRAKETIVVRGAKLYCHEVEDVVSTVEGLEPADVAACAVPDPEDGTESLAIFFVPRFVPRLVPGPVLQAESPDVAATASAVRTRVTERLGVAPRYVVPIPAGEFPRTTSGKKQRATLRLRLESGGFPEVKQSQAPAAKGTSTLPAWFFRRVWRRREEVVVAVPRGISLVLLDAAGLGAALAAALEAEGRVCLRVVCDTPGTVTEESVTLRVDPRDPRRYERLFEIAGQQGQQGTVAEVVHALGYEAAAGNRAGAPTHAAEVLYDLGLLARALVRHVGEGAPPIRLQLVASGAQAVSPEEAIDGEQALLAGVVETLALELPELDVRHLDLPPLPPQEAAEVVLRELRTATRQREVAWRDGRRLVAGVERVLPTPRLPNPFRDGGLWLLTGGLGGIGCELARYLLETHRAHLLLVGRTAPAAGSERAERLFALEALAARVDGGVAFVALDVADEAALRQAIAAAEERWGALEGVLHLAGVLDERLFIEEELPHLAEALRAKVAGTLVIDQLLDQLLASRPEPWLITFSSTATVLGAIGVGAYAAANRFLVAHAHERRRTGGAHSRCLLWHGWEDIGMSRGRLARRRLDAGAEPLSPALAIPSLLAALATFDEDGGGDLIMGLDLEASDVRHLAARPAPRCTLAVAYSGAVASPPEAPTLRDRFGHLVETCLLPVAVIPRHEDGRLDEQALLGAPECRIRDQAPRMAPRNEAEEKVAGIWREVLRVAEVSVHDNFFDLGGHSILLARVRARLQRAFGRDIDMVELFRHPTVAALAAWLAAPLTEEPEPEVSVGSRAARAPDAAADAVAIIGMACRLPGAADVETLWTHLCAGIESVTRFSDEALAAAGVPEAERRDPRYVPARAVLDDVAGFDAAFFGMSAREAEITDPQHRIFLECAAEALERAGYDPHRYPGMAGRIGIFAGAGLDGYLLHHLAADPAALAVLGKVAAVIGNDKDHLSTRVAYKLDLRGPAITIQTACSTSLVATHLACQELLAGRCDMALAGGVSIGFPLGAGYLYQEGHILSPDGHCRAFDVKAAGTVGGDGAGVVVLKRLDRALADGDPVHAVILGSAINNDGAHKVGYTAPSVDGQAEVIAAAQSAACVSAADIGYIEAHGTGTPLGDAIEVAALRRAFGLAAGPAADRAGSCALGSIKSNLGHLNTAAGVAGLIKAALVVERGQIPPTLHVTAPNPEIDAAGTAGPAGAGRSPFFVNTALRPWPRGERPRLAGVSSFGFGGTNAHLVLREPPLPTARPPSHRQVQALFLSARGEQALDAATQALAAHLAARPDLDLRDVAFTLQVGRREFPHRRVYLGHDLAGAVRALAGAPVAAGVVEGSGAPPVAFLFPGQGAQHPGMGEALYRTDPVYREQVDRGCERLRPLLGFDLRELLHPAPETEARAAARLRQTEVAQPALFVVEHALACRWISLGVRPWAMLGHSLGEYVAACLAGVFAYEDALGLVALRGRLMQSLPEGAMLAVELGAEALAPWLLSGLELAAENAPASCVAAGGEEDVATLERRLAARGVRTRRLHTSHAFHTRAVEPILETFAAEVRSLSRSAPRIPWLSNVTGTWITPEEALDPGYWARHLRSPVRFAPALAELLRDPRSLLLEVGPGRALSTLAAAHGGEAERVFASFPSAQRRGADEEAFAETVGRLWVAGVPIDGGAFHAGDEARRVPLPTYRFERRRYWIDAPRSPAAGAPLSPRPATASWEGIAWQPAPLPVRRDTGAVAGRWLVFSGESRLGEAAADALRAAGAETIRIRAGSGFTREAADAFRLDPRSLDACDTLLGILRGEEHLPAGILYLAGVDASPADAMTALAALLRAIGRRHFRAPLGLVVVTRGALAVSVGERVVPERAAIAGLCAAVPAELPAVDCRLVDVDLSSDEASGEASDEAAEVALAGQVAGEALANGGEPLVAWRGGARWRPVPIPAPHVSPASPQGAWLVVDGESGAGRTAARVLLEAGARVALLTPPQLPPRAQWEAVLAEEVAFDEADETTRLDGLHAALGRALGIRTLAERPGLEEGLKALCTAWVVRFLEEAGVDLSAGAAHDREALRGRLGIVPALGRMFDALLDTLVEDGVAVAVVEREGATFRLTRDAAGGPAPEALHERLQQAHPEVAGLLDLLLHCAHRHRAALTGEIDAIGVLYPGGNAHFVEDCERRTAEYRSDRQYILLLREAVRALVSAARGRRVRILEVGGGQGLLTWPLLAALRGFDVTYHFTDLGKTFVEDARREAARRGLAGVVPCDVFDISRPAEAQGFASGAYDLIVAYNVLHAAPDVPQVLRNLRGLLAPGGTLGFVEVVRTYRWDTLTWGLAEGWWYFNDDVRHGSPLLGLDAWEGVLRREGYGRVTSFPRRPDERLRVDHGLVLARVGDTGAPEHRQPPGPERAAIQALCELEQRGALLVEARRDEGAALARVVTEVEERLGAGPLQGAVVDGTATRASADAPLWVVEPAAWPERLAAWAGEFHALDQALHGRAAACRWVLMPAAGGPGALPLRRLMDELVRTAGAPWVSLAWDSAALDTPDTPGTLDTKDGLASLLARVPAITGPLALRRIASRMEQEAAPAAMPSVREAEPAARPRPAERTTASLPRHTRPSLRTSFVAPRTALERRIAATASELLGVDRIGIHDDFFELGADSLIMLRLTDQLSRELGRPVPREAAFRGASVERLAQALEGGGGERGTATSPLVPIQPEGTRPPIYFAHPASGSVFVYIELARVLGRDQPFYALQALGLDGQDPIDTRIEDMARHYVDAIRAVQPHGPYHLGGWSFGCLVAYEMAVQLAAAGEQVGFLALIDEPAPIEGYRPSLWIMARLFATGAHAAALPLIRDYLYLVDETRAETPRRFAKLPAIRDWVRAVQRLPRGSEMLRTFVARSTLAHLVPAESRLLALRQPAIMPLFELYVLHCRLTLEYEPRAYPYKITLFKTTDLGGARGRDATQGWRMLAAGGVDVHRVPGDHMSLLRQPHVQVLAAKLAACLEEVQRELDGEDDGADIS